MTRDRLFIADPDVAYVEHVMRTLFDAAQEARLLVALRFDVEHVSALIKHMIDLQSIVEESDVELNCTVQQQLRDRLNVAATMVCNVALLARKASASA